MDENSKNVQAGIDKLYSNEFAGLEALSGARLDRVVEYMIQNASEEAISTENKKILTRSLFAKHLDEFVLVDGVKRSKGHKPKLTEVVEIDLPSLLQLVDNVLSERAAINEVVEENDETSLRIVYENEQFLVIDKKPGLVVHPAVGHSSGTIANLVKGYLTSKGEFDERVDRAGIVHRLDRGVSGYMVIAKTLEAQIELKESFENHEVIKIYSATVRKNRNTEVSAQIEEKLRAKGQSMSLGIADYKGVIDEQSSISPLESLNIQQIEDNWVRVGGYIGRDGTERKRMRFAQEKVNDSYRDSLSFIMPIAKDRLLIRIKTGRTHQIRATLAFCGYSILGDITYGGSKASKTLENRANEVIMLRSILLSFTFRGSKYLFSAKS